MQPNVNLNPLLQNNYRRKKEALRAVYAQPTRDPLKNCETHDPPEKKEEK